LCCLRAVRLRSPSGSGSDLYRSLSGVEGNKTKQKYCQETFIDYDYSNTQETGNFVDDPKTINRLKISEDDLNQSIAFLKTAKNLDPESIEFEALVISAIIFYARPFSCNETSSSAKADSRVLLNLKDLLIAEELDLHDRIINRRNKAIAHGEWEEFPTSTSFIASKTTITGSQRYQVYPEFINLSPFIALAKKLKDFLSSELSIKKHFP